MSSGRTSSRQAGFTLIEVLVALVLMALLSLISWRGLDAVQQADTQLQARSGEMLALVRVLAQLERDLQMHADTSVLPGDLAVRLSGLDDAGALDAEAELPLGQPTRGGLMPAGVHWSDESGLALIRATGEGRWQRVRWYVREGRLYRATGQPSYQWPLPPTGEGFPVLEAVRSLTLRVWQPGDGWRDPARLQTQTPAPTQSARTAPRGAGPDTSSSPTGLEVSIYSATDPANRPYRAVVVLS